MLKPTDFQPNTVLRCKAKLSAKTKKPTFTRLRLCQLAGRDYVVIKNHKPKPPSSLVWTHSGMLHQSRTLKDTTADKPQDRHETGNIREPHGSHLYDNIVEMSETPIGVSVTAPLTRSETGPVTDPGSGRKAGPRHFQKHKNQSMRGFPSALKGRVSSTSSR